jgi:2-polyprenyl-6-methoxyphenol hydroxylase-like FAD-dependent oxidoreductase
VKSPAAGASFVRLREFARGRSLASPTHAAKRRRPNFAISEFTVRKGKRRAMRVAVIGGGPAGLYFATLWKKRHFEDEVLVVEQNPADATFGFGVVFSDRALDFLRDDDPETCDLITSHMETWHDMTLVHRGETVTIDGVGFSSIGRLHLLQLLQRRALSAGAMVHFGRAIDSLDQLRDFDLIVAADGLNSVGRRT